MHRPFVFGDQGVELFRFKKLNHVRNVFILLKFEGHFRTLFGTGNFTEFCGRIFEVIGQEGLVGDKTLVTRGLVSLAVFVSIDGTAVATDSASQAARMTRDVAAKAILRESDIIGPLFVHSR